MTSITRSAKWRGSNGEGEEWLSSISPVENKKLKKQTKIFKDYFDKENI